MASAVPQLLRPSVVVAPPAFRHNCATMPLFRKLKSDEQVAELQRRAEETRTKKVISDIAATIKANPMVGDVIRRELARLNIDVIDSSAKKQAAKANDGEGDT